MIRGGVMAVYPNCAICGGFMDFPDVVQVHKGCISKTMESASFAPTDTARLKLPKVEEIISEIVGSRNSMHDTAVMAGINECYRIIVRQLSA